jgi:hypothetical protein
LARAQTPELTSHCKNSNAQAARRSLGSDRRSRADRGRAQRAGPARHLTIEFHEAFPSDFLSSARKIDVAVSFDATLNVTLVYNRAGLLVREIDPSGGGRVT